MVFYPNNFRRYVHAVRYFAIKIFGVVLGYNRYFLATMPIFCNIDIHDRGAFIASDLIAY